MLEHRFLLEGNYMLTQPEKSPTKHFQGYSEEAIEEILK